MSFFEPMAFRYALCMVSYGLPKNDGRLVFSKRLRRARPSRFNMLIKFNNAFFIPNVTLGKSLSKCEENKPKQYLCQEIFSEEKILKHTVYGKLAYTWLWLWGLSFIYYHAKRNQSNKVYSFASQINYLVIL